MLASSSPFASSNTTPPAAVDLKPKSAFARLRLATGPAFSAAVTPLPTATIWRVLPLPCCLKPMSPDSVTKSARLALKPRTPKATVLAAMA